MHEFDFNLRSGLERELSDLDQADVEVNGQMLKPSDCFRMVTDPPHILFNTNCPDSLKERVQQILKKYTEPLI